MRIRTISCFVLAGMLSFNSCVKGDIDELQNQIDDLNEKVEDLESTQQETLLAAIANLEAQLAALNSELVGDLALLEEEITNNANAVYYGNVITEADYAAFTAQGATIITGRVVVAGDAHVTALKDVKLIGKSLEITGGSVVTMDALQSVGEDLMLSGLSGEGATVNLAVLASVGGDLEIMNNAGLTSFMADEMVLISGALMTEKSEMLATLSLAKLDQVGELSIDNYYADDPNYVNIGALANLDLSGANVLGDAYLNYVGAEENLMLGDVEGDFTCRYSAVANISLAGTGIGGDFVLEYNQALKTVATDNVERVEGDFTIVGNNGPWDNPGAGLADLPAFSELLYIGGNVTIQSNSDLVTAEALNKVETVGGDSINISGNGSLEIMNIFNALTETKISSNFLYANLSISVKTNWFNGFAKLPKINDASIQINTPTEDGGFGISSVSAAIPGVAKFEGFDMLTQALSLELRVGEVTTFDAFPVFENVTKGSWAGRALLLQIPADDQVGMCSMSLFLNKVKNGDFDSKDMYFEEYIIESWGGYGSQIDKDTAMTRALSACGV